MIVLFSSLARVVLRRGELDRARTALTGGDTAHAHRAAGAAAAGWPERLASPAGWADAASYTLADAKMLRKEMTAGYLVAGFLAVLVPTGLWRDVFVSGHGLWTSLEK